MVTIGTGTLIGIAVTIFFSLLGIGIGFLYRISVNINGIESNLEKMNENLGAKLDNIENNTQETTKLLHRIAERTRQRNQSAGAENSGSEEASGETDPFDSDTAENPSGGSSDDNSDVEIIEDREDVEDGSNPDPDLDHIAEGEQNVDENSSSDVSWEYGKGVLQRIEEIEGVHIEELAENEAEWFIDEYDEEELESEQWVSEEAEEMNLLLSRDIDVIENELYMSVAIGENVSQTNFHIARAGFPGLVGTDPNQNALMEGLSELARDMYGDETALTAHSGRIIVSIPTTELEDVKEWIERSAEKIDSIISEETDSENSQLSGDDSDTNQDRSSDDTTNTVN